jgi:hypothetical protein
MQSAREVSKITGKPVESCLSSLLLYIEGIKRGNGTEDECFEAAMSFLHLEQDILIE